MSEMAYFRREETRRRAPPCPLCPVASVLCLGASSISSALIPVAQIAQHRSDDVGIVVRPNALRRIAFVDRPIFRLRERAEILLAAGNRRDPRHPQIAL